MRVIAQGGLGELRKSARSLYSPRLSGRQPRARHSEQSEPMPSVIFPGPEGRLEGRYSPAPRPRAPVAMILHPHSQGGGTMNDRIVQRLYKTFVDRGFATLRFNFRGVG